MVMQINDWMFSPQTHGSELVTPQRISNRCFQMQLEAEGSYECSVTGLVFEASEPVLVRYSVLSWSKFGSFLSNSWKFAGPIFDIDTVNKEASVLTSIHLPHSVCLARKSNSDRFVLFRILHVVDEAFIEPPSDYSGSHVKWSVRSLSPVCPIIPADEQAEYHGAVLIYKRINTNNHIFHVYLALNNISAIKVGTIYLGTRLNFPVFLQELEFTLAEIQLIGFFEVVFDDQPPFEWSLMKSTDEVVWSAVIRSGTSAFNWRNTHFNIERNLTGQWFMTSKNETKIHRGQDLSELDLLQLAENFGSEWRQAAIYLGLLSKDLDDILETEKDVTMQKHKMLVKWKNRRGQGEATASALLESLKKMKNLSTNVRDTLQGTG
uniref:Death domain-containing protein n=1 Tax=Poecilia latipinna TaxID=48699 RepID=A0A3B3VRE7_9TELE